jgi:hypothetical protein
VVSIGEYSPIVLYNLSAMDITGDFVFSHAGNTAGMAAYTFI